MADSPEPSESKDDFLTACRQCDASSTRQGIFDALVGAVCRGDWNKIQGLYLSLQREDRGTSIHYNYSLVTMACKHKQTQILKFLVSEIEVLTSQTLPSEDEIIACWRSTDEGHNSVYYAIRSGSVELLDTLLGLWPNSHPELLDQLLSESYAELKLLNILLTDEIEECVQYKLIDLRFFITQNVEPTISKTNEMEELIKRIKLQVQVLLQNITVLTTKYSTEKVDETFIYIAKFIALNIHILKQQVMSTYKAVPWEEMEFCLLCFIVAQTRRQEINVYYLSILRRERLLQHLLRFSKTMITLDISKLNDGVRSRRDRVVEVIINESKSELKTDCSLQDLYDDFKQVRDLTSLDIMSRSIKMALRADSATREGQLSIKRALQVVGEYLKNTVSSPNLSTDVSELLLMFAPKQTRDILQTVRDSLSHLHSPLRDDLKLYYQIQNDLKKIGNAINDILYGNKINILKRFTFVEIVKCENIYETQKILKIFSNLTNVDTNQLMKIDDEVIREDQLIEDLLLEIDMHILDQTREETKILDELRVMLNEFMFVNKSKQEEYTKIISDLQRLSQKTFSTKCEMKRYMYYYIDEYEIDNKSPIDETAKLSPGNNHLSERKQNVFLEMILQFREEIFLRHNPKLTDRIKEIICKIIVITWRDKRNINWIDDFREKLSPGESQRKRKKSKKTIINCDRGELDKQLQKNLTELRDIIETARKDIAFCNQLVGPVKVNKKTSAIEILMLDIMSLVDDDYLPNNVLYLQDSVPLLSGRCLRNYLAHGNALVDSISLADSLSVVLLNAMKLTLPETKNDLVLNKKKMGQVPSTDIQQFVSNFEKGLLTIKKYKEMCTVLVQGNLESLEKCFAEGADANARNNLNWSTTLHVAAQGSNLEVIRALIARNVNTDALDIDGQSPLHVAAAFGRDSVVKILIGEAGFSVDHADNYGRTPLHLAVTKGYEKTVLTLLTLGAKPTTKDHAYQTPLHYAVQTNNLEIVKVLLEKDATVDDNKSNGGCTALHKAAECGHIELVQYLMQNRADVNAKSFSGERPLHLAALNGHPGVAIALLEKGAHVNLSNLKGFTPLHNAAKGNHPKVVEVLLKWGAFVKISDKVTDRTPLHTAARNGNKEIVSILLRHKADVNVVSVGDKNRTPLLYAAEVHDGELTNLLVQSGAELDARDDDGMSPLHVASMHGYNDVVKSLIKKGSNIEAENSQKMTPLHMAAAIGHRETVEILLSAGTNVDSLAEKSFNQLFLSTSEGHESVTEILSDKKAKSLIKKGSNIEAENSQQMTPLHLAAANGQRETVEILLSAGANVDSLAVNSLTPLFLCTSVGHESVTQILIDKKANVNAKDINSASPLHNAVKRSCNEKTVRLLLKCTDIDVNMKNTTNTTALHNAVAFGNVNMVDALIQHKADVNALDEDGKSPLYMAVNGNYKQIVSLLLDNGADVNSLTKNGASALCSAVLLNNKDIIELLMKKGASVNEKDGKPLKFAILTGRRQALKSLLGSEGIDVHMVYDGWNALGLAAQIGDWKIAKMLIEKGAAIDTITTPLFVAVANGHKEFLDVLLENKSDANLTPPGEVSLLHKAIRANHSWESLLHWIDRRDAREGEYNDMPLESAVAEGNMETLEILFRNQDNCKDILLILAAYTGNVEIVKFLVNKGADTNVRLGMKAIHLAALGGHLEVVKYFLETGMSIGDVDMRGSTLLHYTAITGQAAVAQYLIGKKADLVDAPSLSGDTPIHIAARKGRPDVVKLLLGSGATYDAVNLKGEKPFDLTENLAIKELLVSAENLFKAVTENDVSRVEILSAENMIILNAKQTNNASLLHLATLNGFELICEILLKNKSNPNTIRRDGYTPLHYASLYSHFEITKCLLINGSIYNQKAADGKIPLDCAAQDNIIHLLRLVDDTFKKVRDHNIHVIEDLTRLGDNAMLRAVLKVRNEGSNTLLEVATRCAFPEVKKLKQLLQGHLFLTFSKVEKMRENHYYTLALSTLTTLLNERQDILGDEDLGTLDIQYNIGRVLNEQCKQSEALQIFQEIHKQQKKSLGANNPISLNTRSQIATILNRLGKNKESWDIFQEVMEKQKEFLNEDPTNVLETFKNAAVTLRCMGNWEKALKLYREVHKHLVQMYHEHHPDVLSVNYNIATVLSLQGHYREAFAIHEQNYTHAKIHLGSKHAVTLEARLGMALSLRNLDPFDKACTVIIQEVLDNQMHLPGSYIHSFLKLQYRLAVLLLLQDKCDEGLAAYKEAINLEDAAEFLSDHRENEALDPIIKKFVDILLQRFDIPIEVINSLVSNTESVIIKVVCEDDILAMESLIQNGSDVNSTDSGGRTPLHYAAGRGRLDMVTLLLRSGADATLACVVGNTPLHYAAIQDDADIVRALLQTVETIKINSYDSFINARNKEGASALHGAAKSGFIDVVMCLLENGAIYNSVGKCKYPPFQGSCGQAVISILESTEVFGTRRNLLKEVQQYCDKHDIG